MMALRKFHQHCLSGGLARLSRPRQAFLVAAVPWCSQPLDGSTVWARESRQKGMSSPRRTVVSVVRGELAAFSQLQDAV